MDKQISRRDFLKGLGAAFVAATVPSKESPKERDLWDYIREAYVDYWPQHLDVTLFQLYFEVSHYCHLLGAIEAIFGIQIRIPVRANKD